MNDLLIENDHQSDGAKIGKLNISLISYCDDLIILSPCVNHVNKILQLCNYYAKKWKLVFFVKNLEKWKEHFIHYIH
jgi:hypothetical protein